MSLPIGALALPDQPEPGDATKIGVLMGSALSALLGYALLRFSRPEEQPTAPRAAAASAP